MSMTPRDRVLAQINHRETDHVPYNLAFEGDVPERLDVHYGSSRWRDLLVNHIRRIPSPNLVVDTTGGDVVRCPYGSLWQVNRRPFHLVRPALDMPSLKGFVWPDLDVLFDEAWRSEATEQALASQESLTVAGFGFGLFERTWTLRGFSEALMDAAGDPAFYEELVEAVVEHQMEILERLLSLPVDGIMFSDDWGYQEGVLLGPDRWRRFIKPRLRRMYERVHAAGKLTLSHCCGSVSHILADIIEIGLDVLESVQPEARGMDPFALKREFGRDITFWGGLGSQSTIPHGTPDEIKQAVARLCGTMGQGGGFILGPAKALQPETPTENAAAVIEAFLAEAGVRWP